MGLHGGDAHTLHSAGIPTPIPAPQPGGLGRLHLSTPSLSVRGTIHTVGRKVRVHGVGQARDSS